MMGSAGTASSYCNGANSGSGGNGGGAILVNATIYASINGSLIVDGVASASSSCSGGLPSAGSGGSIYVVANTLGLSTGLLRSNGGDGSLNTYSGSGNNGA